MNMNKVFYLKQK